MGNTFEIHAWAQWDGQDWSYRQMWRGESLIQALISLRRVKRQGYGCVKFYWR